MGRWFHTFGFCPEVLFCEGAAAYIVNKAALHLNSVFVAAIRLEMVQPNGCAPKLTEHVWDGSPFLMVT